jgi:hypothetical protein
VKLLDDVPKLKITKVGSFNDKGEPTHWAFDGSSHPQSSGFYVDFGKGIELFNGYTIEELHEIYLADMEGRL